MGMQTAPCLPCPKFPHSPRLNILVPEHTCYLDILTAMKCLDYSKQEVASSDDHEKKKFISLLFFSSIALLSDMDALSIQLCYLNYRLKINYKY